MTRQKIANSEDRNNNLKIISSVADEITKTYVQELRDIINFPQAWLSAAGEITDIYVQEMRNIIEFSNSLNQRIKSFNQSRKKLKL